MIILWFGIYNPDFGRNKIYIEALREAGHTVLECRDTSPGLLKYVRLWQKHKFFEGTYDVLVVGYPGHIITPLARFISTKKIIVDALGSLYDAETNSHDPSLWREIKSRVADWLMVRYADTILLESEAQKKYFSERFGFLQTCKLLYTGVDRMFERAIAPEPMESCLVVFRGKLTPECGILYILKAAEILKPEKHIKFRVIGSGYLLDEALTFIREHELSNVELISERLDEEDFVRLVHEGDIMLGQFERNPRLDRTIPHKAFEAFASSIVYVTTNVPAIREVVEEGKTGFLVPIADERAIADKILSLYHQPTLRYQVAQEAYRQYTERFSGPVTAQRLLKIML
jgi:glycosyltransferase involved in cell wall biosynthesis